MVRTHFRHCVVCWIRDKVRRNETVLHSEGSNHATEVGNLVEMLQSISSSKL